MRLTRTCVLLLAGCSPLSTLAQAPAAQIAPYSIGRAPAGQLPDGPNRETVQRICSGCHSVQMFVGRGMTRQQWGGVVSNMIGRGAKISDEEYDQIVEYLGRTLPPGMQSGGTAPVTAKATPPVRKKNLIDQAGSDDKQVVDDEAAARGKTV